MPFPLSPTDGQTHSEGGINFEYVAASNGWKVAGSTGATNLTFTRDATTVTVVSDTGTDVALPAADTSNAGVMTAAQVTKLASIETNAAADQDATEVPFASGQGLTSTDVGAALDEIQTAVSALSALGGVYVGAATTFAGLPTVREDGQPVQNGDFAILQQDDGGNQAGYYHYNGSAYQLSLEVDEPVASATEILAGVVELATNAEAEAGSLTTHAVTPANLPGAVASHETTTALSNTSVHLLDFVNEDNDNAQVDIRVPVVSALPADDSAAREYILEGDANLPDGKYWFNTTAGSWIQGG